MKMTKPNYNEVIVLLDRSGSMQCIKDDVVGGINSFINEQKKVDGQVKFTLVQFDSDDVYEVVYDAINVNTIEHYDNFRPRGMTPLLDAVGIAIVKTGERLSKVPEYERPSRVVFVIFTDGYENASIEYTKPKIKEMITHQEEKYNWKFMFLGANIDTFAEGGSIGVRCCNTSGYNIKKFNLAARKSAEKVRSYFSGSGDASLSYTNNDRNELA